ncbi:hypothetical protein [Alloactinosynnema sp. L-07]|nr:hypothetical protein [Alloactinosynnema sp. L-07]
MPTTGKRIRISAVSIARMGPDGRFAEQWTLHDRHAVLAQLGAEAPSCPPTGRWASPSPAPDTDDMVAVHRIFRRELRLLARIVRRCPPVVVPRSGRRAPRVHPDGAAQPP